MDEEGIQVTKTSKFNAAQDILQSIGFLKYKASEKYVGGDIEGWYYNWKQIKFYLIGRMDDEEKTEFLNIESKISYFLNRLNNLKPSQKNYPVPQ